MPKSVNNYLIHAKEWRDLCKVPNFIYEYHFWWPQYRDFGLFGMAQIIHNDVKGYKANGCSGIVEDGSQRSYFPNGFMFTTYASTLYDVNSDFEELKQDYFKHAYGDDYKTVIEMFDKLGETVDFKYYVGSMSADSKMGKFYNPAMVEKLLKIPAIIDEYMPFIEAHKNMPYRAQTVAYRMLALYLEFAKRIAPALALKANDKEKEALEEYERITDWFGQYELQLERWYDQNAMVCSLNRIFKNVRVLFDAE